MSEAERVCLIRQFHHVSLRTLTLLLENVLYPERKYIMGGGDLTASRRVWFAAKMLTTFDLVLVTFAGLTKSAVGENILSAFSFSLSLLWLSLHGLT